MDGAPPPLASALGRKVIVNASCLAGPSRLTLPDLHRLFFLLNPQRTQGMQSTDHSLNRHLDHRQVRGFHKRGTENFLLVGRLCFFFLVGLTPSPSTQVPETGSVAPLQLWALLKLFITLVWTPKTGCGLRPRRDNGRAHGLFPRTVGCSRCLKAPLWLGTDHR